MAIDEMDAENTDLDAFFNALNFRLDLVRKARLALDRELASGFSVFRYIDSSELALSEMVADLLDPQGPHGQGDLFLRDFLKRIGHEDAYSDGDRVEVRREERTRFVQAGRRIDVVVRLESLVIGIENKPYAEESERQLADYVEELERQSPEFCLIFLGRQAPTSIDSELRTSLESNKQFRMFFYHSDLRGWLECAYKECRAERVRWFLRDFIEFVDQEFADEES